MTSSILKGKPAKQGLRIEKTPWFDWEKTGQKTAEGYILHFMRLYNHYCFKQTFIGKKRKNVYIFFEKREKTLYTF